MRGVDSIPNRLAQKYFRRARLPTLFLGFVRMVPGYRPALRRTAHSHGIFAEKVRNAAASGVLPTTETFVRFQEDFLVIILMVAGSPIFLREAASGPQIMAKRPLMKHNTKGNSALF